VTVIPDPFQMRLETNPHTRFLEDKVVVRATWAVPTVLVEQFVASLGTWYGGLPENLSVSPTPVYEGHQMSVTYVRWKAGEPRESARVLGPLDPSHPAAGFPCLCCGQPLGDGRPVQLLALGPDSDATRAECQAGYWFSALALTLHAECIGTLPPEPEPAGPPAVCGQPWVAELMSCPRCGHPASDHPERPTDGQ
jgi:hypothetical protein